MAKLLQTSYNRPILYDCLNFQVINKPIAGLPSRVNNLDSHNIPDEQLKRRFLMLNSTSSTSLTTQLCQPETLETAWRKVRGNKGGPGSDGVTIQQFEIELNRHLRQLGRELAEERYYPLPVQKFTIKKANGRARQLSVLTLRDRIVQRAICDLLTPIYEAKFLNCSFAFRPNRGVPHAIAEVAAIRAEGYEWVVHADIENFFDTMDSGILMRFLRATIKERSILRLIQMWLDMGAITQPSRLSRLGAHIENTAQYVGEGVEQLINHLLHRAPKLDGYTELQHPPMTDDWLLDESALDKKAGIWSQTSKEALMNLGRDGLMLLLANSKGIWRCLSAKQLLFLGPVALAVLAAPTVGGIVKDHLDRPRKIGIIQGSPLSPLLANIYLHSFDKAMTRAGIRIVRYADDLILLCRSEGRARYALRHAQKRLATLKLQFNSKKTQIAHFDDGVEFLGHIFDRDGCYQPVPDARTKILQDQVQHALKKGAVHVSRSGRNMTRQGKHIATRLGERWKRRGIPGTSAGV